MIELTAVEQYIAKQKGLNFVKTCRIISGIYNKTITDQNNGREVIKRLHLTQTIQNVLGITDPHTINSYINQLISRGLIELNPHTSLSAQKRVYKPTPDTRYYIGNVAEYTNQYSLLLKQFKTTHPHTVQSTLEVR